jgi:hypothetical protein
MFHGRPRVAAELGLVRERTDFRLMHCRIIDSSMCGDTGVCWERYIRGGILGEVYSAFESWRDATIVICLQLS